MAELMARWSADWTCVACGVDNSKELSRREAAFFDGAAKPLECVSCGAKTDRPQTITAPELDAQILTDWVENDALHLAPQDEDLMLSFLPFETLSALWPSARSATGKEKVLSVMLVKLYDEDFTSAAEQRACADWLFKHQTDWIGDPNTMDYLRIGVRQKLEETYGELRRA